MEGTFGKALKLIRGHFVGIAVIVGLLIASNISVRVWKAKHPGAMSVIEAQAMDMTAMKPPVGAVPVAAETVHLSNFSGKVTYTGSVAPYTEQNIYPRVEGWLTDLKVYNGDKVTAGQLLAVVDSPDLQTRVQEASAGHSAAASEVSVARSAAARMVAERAAAQGEVETAKSDLAGAKAKLVASRRAVTQAEKDLKSAKADLEYWRVEIQREKKLLKGGAVSLQEYQAEKAKATTAEAEVENRQARLQEAQANVEAAQAAVSSKEAMIGIANQKVAAASAAVAASRQEVSQKSAAASQAAAMVDTASVIDSYRNVRAPFAGLITKRYIHPGVFVKPSNAILNLVQIDKVRLQANVSDKDLDKIQVGAPITAKFTDDPGRVYNARVTSVSPLADQASRTALVEAIVDNPGHKLVPGDFVTMEIATSSGENAISVPTSALVQKDGKDAVWIVKQEAPKGKMLYYCTMHPEVVSDKPGRCPKCNMKLEPKTSGGNKKARLVSVTLGDSDGERTEIASGLNDGDEVIYRGNTYLREGDVVFPTEWGDNGPKKMPKAPGMSNMSGMPGMGKSDTKMDMPGVEKQDMKGMDMSGTDKSDMKAMQMPGKDSAKPRSAVKNATSEKTYTCPMHPEVISHKPGDCPKCGMHLVEVKGQSAKKMDNMPGMDGSKMKGTDMAGKNSAKAESEKTYTCPMHPEVISHKPGDCPKCGMHLVEKK